MGKLPVGPDRLVRRQPAGQQDLGWIGDQGVQRHIAGAPQSIAGRKIVEADPAHQLVHQGSGAGRYAVKFIDQRPEARLARPRGRGGQGCSDTGRQGRAALGVTDQGGDAPNLGYALVDRFWDGETDLPDPQARQHAGQGHGPHAAAQHQVGLQRHDLLGRAPGEGVAPRLSDDRRLAGLARIVAEGGNLHRIGHRQQDGVEAGIKRHHAPRRRRGPGRGADEHGQA